MVAVILGITKAVSELKLPISIGIVPSVENMPDGESYRPETQSNYTMEQQKFQLRCRREIDFS